MTGQTATIARRPYPKGVELHPNALVNRVLAARGISADEALDYRLDDLLRPDALGGLHRASELLAEAVCQNSKITVVGDYDTDGATSTTLAITALEACGAQCVDFLIPNRFDMGYGLGEELVQQAAAQGCELILTVDNGISSVAGVALAKTLGMTVVITDHHLPGEQLPAADATVNPNLNDDHFGSKNLAGVGVVFYVMHAVCHRLQERDWFAQQQRPRPNPAEWLDLVALGTVADLVPLDRNNRILVEQGLRRIRAGKARPGIAALLQLGKRRYQSTVASDMGFAVAPRLNAAGRLDDMQRGVQCLRATDPQQALKLANDLEQLNLSRREIESDMHSDALEAVQRLQQHLDGEVPAALCLFEPEWHQGVCGIIAGRLKDRFQRPAMVFARADDGQLRGSARSIAGLHIRDLMARIDAAHPGLIEKFGGHAMAAGLTLKESHFESFKAEVQAAAQAHLLRHPPVQELLSDGPLEPDHYNLELAKLLRYAAPWGQGFEEPRFDGEFIVQSERVVGERHLKLTLSPVQHKDTLLDAIAFGQADKIGFDRCRAVFRLDINHWRGRDTLQLMVDHLSEAQP